MKKANTTTPSDWRARTMARIRKLIKQADPQAVEAVKWKTPSNPAGALVWYHDGMITTGETYKNHLRLAFAKGPLLKKHDPQGLINTYRAMIIHEGDKLDEEAFQNLVRAAVALNREGASGSKSQRGGQRKSTKRRAAPP